MPSETYNTPADDRRWTWSTTTTVKATGRVTTSLSQGNAGATTSRQKYRYWVRTPNYRTLVQQGARLPDNPYEFKQAIYSLQEFRMSQTVDYGGSIDTHAYHAPGVPVPDFTTYPSAWTVSTSGLAAQIVQQAKGAQFSVPVFAAEGRQTVLMVAGALRRLRRTVVGLAAGRFEAAFEGLTGRSPPRRQVARFNRNFGRDPTQAAANAWLEMSYGWIPLLHDVGNAVLLYKENAMRLGSQIATVRAKSHAEWETRESNHLLHTCYANTNYALRGDSVLRHKESARMVWRFSPTGLNFYGQLGLLNPLEVAWELVPLSFVADWFLPIGDFLSSLDVDARFTHRGGTVGRRYEVVQTTTPRSPSKPVWTGGFGKNSRVWVKREPLLAAPTPRLADITWSPELGARRVTSGIALLRNALVGKLTKR